MFSKRLILILSVYAAHIYCSCNYTGQAVFVPADKTTSCYFGVRTIPYQIPFALQYNAPVRYRQWQVADFAQKVSQVTQETQTIAYDYEEDSTMLSSQELEEKSQALSKNIDRISLLTDDALVSDSEHNELNNTKQLAYQTLTKINNKLSERNLLLSKEHENYAKKLEAMNPEQQSIELTKINKTLEREYTLCLAEQHELACCRKEINKKQERIKLYEDNSLKSIATLLVKQAIFYSPQDAIAQEKSDLKVLNTKASMYEKSIANRKLLIEKLTLQRNHCQRILQQKIKSSTLEIHDIDNPALYDLEYKISKSYKLAGDEKTRLTQALGNTKRESKEYNLLTQNLEKISEAYNTCGQAQIATRNEIGRRLYTPEYIAFLQDTRAELTQQIYDGAADSDTQGLLDAVNTSLNNPMNINEVNIQLDGKTLNWLKDHVAETSDFNHFTGDPVGRYIFKKNIDTLLKARDIEFVHSSKAIARDCCQVVVNFGGAALDMVKDGLVQEAKRFTDIASAIYNLTHFTVNTAYGALEGSAEGCYAFATMCTHPVETIQKISGAIETIDDFVDRLFMLDPTAIDEAKTLGHTLIQSCKEFRQLPLDQKGYYIGKCIGFIWGPGAIAKGTKCLTALPKIQKGLTALSQMASTEMATLTQFAKNTATGVMLATKTSEAELVTLGGKVMSKELAEAFTYAHSKIGGTLPLKDFVSFIQKTQTPITQSFKRAFSTIEKMNALHIDPKTQSLLKIPYLIDEARFEQVVTLLKENEIIKNIGGEIFIQGSRAKGTAKIYSDIDIGIRVSATRFEELIQECFPNAANCKFKTMQHALKTGKIHRRALNLSKLGKRIEEILGIQVDLSAILSGGPFDIGPFINL